LGPPSLLLLDLLARRLPSGAVTVLGAYRDVGFEPAAGRTRRASRNRHTLTDLDELLGLGPHKVVKIAASREDLGWFAGHVLDHFSHSGTPSEFWDRTRPPWATRTGPLSPRALLRLVGLRGMLGMLRPARSVAG
jgi:hypothetical protein